MKKNIVGIIAGIIGFSIGYFLIGSLFDKEPEVIEKEYSSNGFTITMEDGFFEKDLVSATVYFESQRAIVTALKEKFEVLEFININEDSTLEEYTNAIIKNNNLNLEIKDLDENIKYVTYDTTFNEKELSYMGVTIKGNDAFWLINFACESKNKNTYFPKFQKWAKTIKVN